jgi:hypothetical protein
LHYFLAPSEHFLPKELTPFLTPISGAPHGTTFERRRRRRRRRRRAVDVDVLCARQEAGFYFTWALAAPTWL